MNEPLKRADIESAMACSWTGENYDYAQVAKQLNLVVISLPPLTDSTGRWLKRCQGIKASFGRCKCWAIMYVNAIPYCKQHGEKELRKAQ